MLPVLVRRRRTGRSVVAGCLAALLVATATAAVLPVLPVLPVLSPAAAAPQATSPTRLHLVTFVGPGTALAPERSFQEVRAGQDAILAGVGAPAPVYRWTSALDGVAVVLTDEQAEGLRSDYRVAQVETDTRHRVAGLRSAASAGTGRPGAAIRTAVDGGADVVVGFVDTGLWPEHEVFADGSHPGRLGPVPRSFTGACATTTPGWPAGACRRKVVAARWFVDGFGRDRLHPEESLSARDVAGHGTRVASVAVGHSAATSPDGTARDSFAGTAPQARVGVYKACWTAADPAEDGCAASDLVTAVDQAVRDGVDVLSLAVAPSPGSTMIGTVDRALLGAAEADVVVVGAAGHRKGPGYAGFQVPWVTSVGGLSSSPPRVRLALAGGPTLTGSGRDSAGVAGAPVVLGTWARATGASPLAARKCRAGSLAPDLVRGALVVCRRGGSARTEKSAVVRRAGGAGMVLVDEVPGRRTAELHAVPTVHLDVRAGRRLVLHLRRHPGARARLSGVAPAAGSGSGHVARWSAAGDPQGALVQPDLVAPAARLLAAAPSPERRWTTFSGTSAAAAQVAGLAARLRARHPDWSAARVHSALRTSTRQVDDGSTPLGQGSGVLRPGHALDPGLVFDLRPGQYRRWLDTTLATRDLNVPSLLTRDHGVFTRQVTHVGDRSTYYSSSASGFRHHRVRVEPAALRLDPGETATFRIVVPPDTGAHHPDHGTVEWRSARGATVRMPVVLTR